MKMNTLAGGTLAVSELCLGTMTWGSQNSEAEGHAQIDMSLDHGINFVDTAEMYPTTPRKKETVGNTERIVGTWIEKTGRRDDIVLATKATGPSPLVREEGYHKDNIRGIFEASLERLKTDYVDLYQLHWPARGSYAFRQNWKFAPWKQDTEATLDHMRGVLEVLTDLVAEGKIRHIGLSNESAWGTTKWIEIAKEIGAPRMVSIQNEYSLLCRLFDTDLAEVAHNEDVKLLSYSPLACGILTGKYHGGNDVPAGSRGSIYADLGGRTTDRVWPAAQAYLDIADKHGMDPVHLALGFATSRPFMGSVIFGATSEEQLKRALGAADVTLSQEVLAEIDAAHRAHPMPY